MSISLLVTCEKQQELDDLEKVIVELRKVDESISVFLVNLTHFTGEALVPSLEIFDEIISPKALFTKAYYKLGLFKKVITIFYGIKTLLSLIKKKHITHVLYGVSIVFFRGLSFIPLRKYKTFSYIRSTITSDNLKRQKLPNFIIRLLNSIWLTKTYTADYFFCMDDSTKEYIRGLYPESDEYKIQKIGSIYSYDLLMTRALRQDEIQEDERKTTNICFLSSAFSWHGDEQAGNEQLFIIEELLRKVQQFNLSTLGDLRMTIKLHPRDSIETYNDLIEEEGLEILSEMNIKGLDDSYCFISVLSTMSSELSMAGFKSLYVCNDFFKKKIY